jgi:hypothetical protein
MPFKALRNLIVVACGIAGTGYLRMPVEQKLTQDLRERKAIPPPISQEAWSQMGQTSLAGVLGGLRTVMASTMSLAAQTHFEDKEWYDLKKQYELVTTLDPYNRFYWDHGGWHLAYNAAAWARTNNELSPIRRQFLEREFLEAGDAFYHKGLTLLPEDPYLWSEVGRLWSNRHKRPDLNRAAEAYKMAAKYGGAFYQRSYLCILARIPGREIEAFDLATQLLIENRRNLGVSSFSCILFCLSTNPELPETALKVKLGEIFIDKETAYKELYNFRPRVQKEGYYGGEIDNVLKSLIEELHVPDHLNPFKPGSKPKIYNNDWHRQPDRPKILRPGVFPGFPGQQ